MCGSCKKNFRFGINFEKHIAECDPFDIVGTLITEKSLTRENLSSIQADFFVPGYFFTISSSNGIENLEAKFGLW